jgi:hypothetical protein
MHTLDFQTLHLYEPTSSGITIPVELSVGRERVTISNAKLDTGSSFCIFQREYGDMLGLDVEQGVETCIATPTGTFLAYGHEILLSALGHEFLVTVYFASFQGFIRNVLGRHGWLNKVRLGIIDYDGKLYVSAYDEP